MIRRVIIPVTVPPAGALGNPGSLSGTPKSLSVVSRKSSPHAGHSLCRVASNLPFIRKNRSFSHTEIRAVGLPAYIFFSLSFPVSHRKMRKEGNYRRISSASEIHVNYSRNSFGLFPEYPRGISEIPSRYFRDTFGVLPEYPRGISEIGSRYFRDTFGVFPEYPRSISEIGSGYFRDTLGVLPEYPRGISEIGSGYFRNPFGVLPEYMRCFPAFRNPFIYVSGMRCSYRYSVSMMKRASALADDELVVCK